MNDFISHLKEHYSVYSVEAAALLLCDVSEENLKKELNEVERYGTNGETTSHPRYDDFKSCYDILQGALENEQIPCLGGKDKNTNVKTIPKNSRQITRIDLKNWIIKSNPPEVPNSLFDETERKAIMVRSPEAFKLLQEKLDETSEELAQYKNRLKEAVADEGKPSLKILGAVLKLLFDKNYNISQPNSQTELVALITNNFPEKTGLRKRTIEKYFALARRAIDSLSG